MKNIFKVSTPNNLRLCLRSAPNPKGAVLARCKNGTIVTEIGEHAGEWAHVRTPDGAIGYVWAAYLEVA